MLRKFEPKGPIYLSVEEAIRQAIEAAKKTGDSYRLDSFPFVVYPHSDVKEVLSRYWRYKHEEGVANGSIIEVDVPVF